MNYSDFRQRRTAIDQFTAARSVSDLLNALNDPDGSIRSAAAVGLGIIGDPIAVPRLIDALFGDDEWVAIDAATALGKIGSNDAVPALLQMLQAEELRRSFHAEVKRYHQKPPDPRTISALGMFLSTIQEVREAAAQALGQIGDPRAILGLIEALYDTDPVSIANSAAQALEKIGTPEAQAALQLWHERKSVG